MGVKMLNTQATNTSRIVLYFISFLGLSQHLHHHVLVAALWDSRFHPHGWEVGTQSHTAGNMTACQEISTGLFSWRQKFDEISSRIQLKARSNFCLF